MTDTSVLTVGFALISIVAVAATHNLGGILYGALWLPACVVLALCNKNRGATND